MLGKLSVMGRPTCLDDSRATAYCACSRCGWGLFGHFVSHLSFLFSFSLSWGDARYRLKYCLKGPLIPKQPINQLPLRDNESRLYTMWFWKNVDFIGLAIICNSGHFEFSTRLNFISLKPCNLLMLNLKFENHECIGFRE